LQRGGGVLQGGIVGHQFELLVFRQRAHVDTHEKELVNAVQRLSVGVLPARRERGVCQDVKRGRKGKERNRNRTERNAKERKGKKRKEKERKQEGGLREQEGWGCQCGNVCVCQDAKSDDVRVMMSEGGIKLMTSN
jgi:hypothetical protein